MIHTVKGFSVVNEAEVDVFLEYPCFFHDPTVFGNLISGSSAFSKSSLYIWKFLIHVLLKPSLKDFEHYFASMWNEHNCMVVWTFFGASPVAQMVKNLPAVHETWVWSLGWEDPLKEGMATHFSILAQRIPMDRKAWQATVHRVAKNQTRPSNYTQRCTRFNPGSLDFSEQF